MGNATIRKLYHRVLTMHIQPRCLKHSVNTDGRWGAWAGERRLGEEEGASPPALGPGSLRLRLMIHAEHSSGKTGRPPEEKHV